jgi:hypothetical protein
LNGRTIAVVLYCYGCLNNPNILLKKIGSGGQCGALLPCHGWNHSLFFLAKEAWLMISDKMDAELLLQLLHVRKSKRDSFRFFCVARIKKT